jgi:hypothetical protein
VREGKMRLNSFEWEFSEVKDVGVVEGHVVPVTAKDNPLTFVEHG